MSLKFSLQKPIPMTKTFARWLACAGFSHFLSVS